MRCGCMWDCKHEWCGCPHHATEPAPPANNPLEAARARVAAAEAALEEANAAAQAAHEAYTRPIDGDQP